MSRYEADFSDSGDEDFVYEEDSCDELIDEIIFNENIDKDVEWVGTQQNDEDIYESSDDESDDTEESDFESLCSADDDANDSAQKECTSASYNPRYTLGQIFSTKAVFKESINNYAVKVGRPTRFTKNDSRRIYARCKMQDEGCEWHINALKVKHENSFQIRELDLTHTCPRQHKVSNAKSQWLAQKYEKSFRCDPKRTVKGFRSTAMSELKIYISPHQAFRTKQKALKLIEGDSSEQYSKLYDYAEALRETNPDSTVILQVDNTATGNNFKRFYVCLKALKNGFMSGCRPLIGVDGCHLRGLSSDVLLTAVCMDLNNDPYPLAYAVVGTENRDSWEWFLQLLKEDLLVEREDAYIFMSDKQKGLIGAFEKILPCVDNRFCVRHLHENMKRAGFKGNHFKRLLWKAAKATTVAAFNKIMTQIESVDKNCLEWLQKDKSATEWSKSHFQTFGKCDTLVNNLCEQFNACLLDAREKPILTMLQWIREYLMSRLQKNRDKAKRKWEGRLICPRIRKKLEKYEEGASDFTPIKSSNTMYEVSSFVDGSRYVVNLQARSCDCRQWDLSGIPCKHAISAIQAEGKLPEEYVHNCYSVETYMRVYTHAINPMSHDDLWQKTGYIPPLPPLFGKKNKGRPKKERKFGPNEEPKKKKHISNLQKMPKQNFKVRCKFCGEEGHNKLGCKQRKTVEEGTSQIARGGENVTTQGLQGEEITQPEYPTLSQEDAVMMEFIENFEEVNEIHDNSKSSSSNKPSTVAERQLLAKKRFLVANKETKCVSHLKSGPYSISTSINSAQPKQMGVQIRAPPPLSFHAQHYAAASVSVTKERESMKVFTQDGKKFVTLSNLEAASASKRGKMSKIDDLAGKKND